MTDPSPPPDRRAGAGDGEPRDDPSDDPRDDPHGHDIADDETPDETPDDETWQSTLGALARMLPPDTGRTARGDVERLARGDAQRQAQTSDRARERTGDQAGERTGDQAGRADTDRLLRIRSTTRSSRTPQRVRVTSPRMAATARAPARSVSREIDEQTGVGEVYLRSLLRAQLRLGLSVIAVLVLALGTLPLVFALIPPLGSARLFTVPLPWLLVGASVYPLLFGVAWWHVVAAERAERDFAAIVESD